MDYVSLADFADSWHQVSSNTPPEWAVGAPLGLNALGVQDRIEDVLDTVTALQRGDWLEDGVYIGPNTMTDTYRALLYCCRTLRVAVPPAIVAGAPLSAQGVYGTNTRAFLYLSTFYLSGTSTAQKRFLLGRLIGHLAAKQVTTHTLYSLLADQRGLRATAKRAFGPLLEVVFAPLSFGAQVALSQWHRAAVLTADRAGLLCCRDLDASCSALLRLNLGINPPIHQSEYLEQLRRHEGSTPGKWAELLSDRPWTHKRIRALMLFHDSELYSRLCEEASPSGLSMTELKNRTNQLLGIS